MVSLTATTVQRESADVEGLLEQARAGDAEAFCAMCRPHEDRLLRQAIALSDYPGLAEELAQETFVEAWRSLRRYNGRCQFFTWLCAILLNRHRNVLRQRHPIPFSTLAGNSSDLAPERLDRSIEPGPAPDEAAQHRERSEQMRRCLEGLPLKHRQVIYLRFYAEDSLEGIAAALGCSVGTVKSRLFHALEKLRRMNALPEHERNDL
jgi:RNA polymerase sigma-70 factor (ECF subfamily)